MKRVASVSIACVLLASVAAYAAPAYSLSWDFEGGAGDWVGGSVASVGGFSGTPYPTGNRLYTGDNTASWLNLPAATNSFVYTTQAWTDAGHINGFRKAGMGYGYQVGGEAWFEGKDDGWPVTLIFGDPKLPNPRPGTFGESQWPGGSGKLLDKGTLDGSTNLGGYQMAAASDWELPQFAEIELMVKYNTPDNPGTVEAYFRSLNYDAVRSTQGQWLKLGWGSGSGDFYDFILSKDPVTNDYWDVNRIRLGGQYAWSQAAWDNVAFTSIPEPATVSLLVLGGLAMLRRRR